MATKSLKIIKPIKTKAPKAPPKFKVGVPKQPHIQGRKFTFKHATFKVGKTK